MQEDIEPEIRMRKLRISLLLQEYWPKLMTSKEFEKIYKDTFNKEVIKEHLGKYYIYGKDADNF